MANFTKEIDNDLNTISNAAQNVGNIARKISQGAASKGAAFSSAASSIGSQAAANAAVSTAASSAVTATAATAAAGATTGATAGAAAGTAVAPGVGTIVGAAVGALAKPIGKVIIGILCFIAILFFIITSLPSVLVNAVFGLDGKEGGAITEQYQQLSLEAFEWIDAGRDNAYERIDNYLEENTQYDYELSKQNVQDLSDQAGLDVARLLAGYSVAGEIEGYKKYKPSEFSSILEQNTAMLSVTYEVRTETKKYISEDGEESLEEVTYVVPTIHPIELESYFIELGIDLDAIHETSHMTYRQLIEFYASNLQSAISQSYGGGLYYAGGGGTGLNDLVFPLQEHEHHNCDFPTEVGRYGAYRSPTRTHAGVDIGADEGTPIVACVNGVVVEARWNGQAGANDVGGGNMIIIEDAAGYQYKHLHMQSPSPLKPGDTVIAGSTIIGYVGHTGKGITVPHLHFTVITPEGKTIDGAPYLRVAHDNIGVVRDSAGSGDFGTAPSIALSQDDLELLATIIKLEAGGEPYEGQLAVGTVIMNRVSSPNYPDSVRDVISSKGAFSTWTAAKKNSHNYTESTMRAAKETIAGKRVLPSSVVFFRSYGASETPKQYWYGPLYAQIGEHYFYHGSNEPGCPANQ